MSLIRVETPKTQFVFGTFISLHSQPSLDSAPRDLLLTRRFVFALLSLRATEGSEAISTIVLEIAHLHSRFA